MRSHKKSLCLLFILLVILLAVLEFSSFRVFASTRYEKYNLGDDANSNQYGVNWDAQTFTVGSVGHTVTAVWLNIHRLGSPGTYTVSIRATNSSGFPTGADLTNGTTNGNTLPVGYPYEWREITMTECVLNASTKYAIVMRATSGNSVNYVAGRIDITSPTYGDGNYVASHDSGNIWSTSANYDFMFEVWGNALSLSNDQCSITNMDDGDNLYAQRTWYTIDYDVSHDGGYWLVDYAEVRFKQSSLTRAIFRYDEDTDSFSVPVGYDTWDLDTGSCSATESGTYINMTFKVKPQWDAIEENDLEVECYVIDESSQSDTDTMQSNYFDVITDLTTSFSIDDDRGNPSQTITASGTVTYWGSSLYPPNAEFTSVSVYDSSNNVKGTDATIVNGAWSVSFSASSSVEIETYNLYINMLDADYSDGEESPSDTFITDKLTGNINANSTTLFTGEAVGSIITATYAYDGSAVTSWSLNVLRNSTHYASNNFTDSSETELIYQYTIENVTENTYGLTGFTSNTLTVTWTNLYIEIYQITVNNTRPDINEVILISYQLRYGNNESAVPSGTLWVNSQNYSISSGFANITATKTSVQAVTYNATAVDVNGETDLVQIPEDPQVIWDTLIVTFSASNLFPLPGHNVTISWAIKRSYDSSSVSNFTITVTKNNVAWKENSQLSSASDVSSIVFTANYNASSVTDNTYNLTTFSSSYVQVIWTEEGGQSGSSGSSGSSGTTEEEEEEPLIVTPPKITIPTWGYYVIGGALLLIAIGAIFNKSTSRKRKIQGTPVKKQNYKPRNLSNKQASLRNLNKKRKNRRRRI